MNSLDIVFDTCQKVMDIDLAKRTRKTEFVRAKWIFYGVVFSLDLKCSLNDMGVKTNRDHASVIHGRKMFARDILGVERYSLMYQKCLELCTSAIDKHEQRNKSKGLSDSVLEHIKKQDREINVLKNKLSRVNENPIIRDISELDEHQYHTFMERYKVMIKMIKSIRTYENTPKKEFNAA